MKHLFILIVCGLMVLLPSCRGTRALQPGERPASLRHLVRLVEQNEPSFATMNAGKLSVSLTLGERRFTVAAALRMQTDSVAVFSVMPFMGIEMFSLELYPDHWRLFDKVNRTYYTDTYDYLRYKWGVTVDFATLQAILSARTLTPAVKAGLSKTGRYIPRPEGQSLVEWSSDGLERTLTADASHRVEQLSWSDENGHFRLTASYADYRPVRGVVYPHHIALGLTLADTLVGAVDIEVQRVTFNADLRLSLSTPERYRKGVIGDLIMNIK